MGFTSRAQLKLFDFGIAVLVKKRMFRLKTYKMTNISTCAFTKILDSSNSNSGGGDGGSSGSGGGSIIISGGGSGW